MYVKPWDWNLVYQPPINHYRNQGQGGWQQPQQPINYNQFQNRGQGGWQRPHQQAPQRPQQSINHNLFQNQGHGGWQQPQQQAPKQPQQPINQNPPWVAPGGPHPPPGGFQALNRPNYPFGNVPGM